MITNTISNHPVLLSFQEELTKSPADFERKKHLYHVAALVSGIAAAALFVLSFTVFQTAAIPFWANLLGSLTTQFAGYSLLRKVNELIDSASKAKEKAKDLQEIQKTYKSYQDTELSDTELSENKKIIIFHTAIAGKKYNEAKQNVEKLTHTINFSLSSSDLEDKIKEVITLKHQLTLLKIDFAFKKAILKAIDTNKLNCITKQRDIFIISDLDPLAWNQVQTLANTLENLYPPLLFFTKDPSKNLSYQEMQEISPNCLAKHIFTVMKMPPVLAIQ